MTRSYTQTAPAPGLLVVVVMSATVPVIGVVPPMTLYVIELLLLMLLILADVGDPPNNAPVSSVAVKFCPTSKI